MFIIDFQGQHFVVIVGLTSSWLAPSCSSTTQCKTYQPFVALPPVGWHHAGILTSAMEFPFGTDTCSILKYTVTWSELVKHPKPPQTNRYSSSAACRMPALFPSTTGILKPYGHQCLRLKSRVSLWASMVKLLIGHGSSITQRNPVHPKSHPNS